MSDPRAPARSLGLRILIVEDDEAIRQSLTWILENEGYAVAAAGDAEAGLALLEASRPHLLITDFRLPGASGAWLIQEARARGLVGEVPPVMISAEQDVPREAGALLVRKPFDLDLFLAKLDELLHPVRDAELHRAQLELAERFERRREAPGAGVVELVLYISASSPSSLRATRNLQALLRSQDPARVQLTIVDLARDIHPSVEEDRIVFTPTLVRRRPAPKAWIIGSLDDREKVLDLLRTECE